VTLYFTREIHGKTEEYYAIDPATDRLYQAIRAKHRWPGWLGLVTDYRGKLLHQVDWTDHRVQVGEMWKKLSFLASE
jgi:hypothetical protein